jgi:hypothetical protein
MFGLEVVVRLASVTSSWQKLDRSAAPPRFDDVLEYITAQVKRCFPDLDSLSCVAIERHRTSTNPVLRFIFTRHHAQVAIVAKWCQSDASNDEGLAECAFPGNLARRRAPGNAAPSRFAAGDHRRRGVAETDLARQVA